MVNVENSERQLESLLEERAGRTLDQSEIIALLREIQTIYGSVPRSAQQQITERLGILPSVLSALIRVIPSLTEETIRHRIVVCMGPRCRPKGAGNLLNAIERKLKITAGESTADGRFSLTTRQCLKQCKTAPNVMIDGTVYPYANADNISVILDQYP